MPVPSPYGYDNTTLRQLNTGSPGTIRCNGDVRLAGHYQRGWLPVINGPMAFAVACEWWPRIGELSQGAKP